MLVVTTPECPASTPYCAAAWARAEEENAPKVRVRVIGSVIQFVMCVPSSERIPPTGKSKSESLPYAGEEIATATLLRAVGLSFPTARARHKLRAAATKASESQNKVLVSAAKVTDPRSVQVPLHEVPPASLTGTRRQSLIRKALDQFLVLCSLPPACGRLRRKVSLGSSYRRTRFTFATGSRTLK